jgi:TRAP-type mannitol/chloroaromatic compound transport system substrate-binding protein
MQVNKSQWERLPKDYQQVLKTATMEANLNMLAQYDALNGQALRRLVAAGTKLTPYSKEIMQAAQKASFDLYEQNAAKNATFKQVYEQWKAFREQVYKWNQVNELSYANFTYPQ